MTMARSGPTIRYTPPGTGWRDAYKRSKQGSIENEDIVLRYYRTLNNQPALEIPKITAQFSMLGNTETRTKIHCC